jgi:hypothetical protein
MLKPMLFLITCFANVYVFAQDSITTSKQNLVISTVTLRSNQDLEVEKVYIRSRLSLSMYLLGIGTIKVNHVVPGLRSPTRFTQSEKMAVSIESELDSITLLKEIGIFKLNQDKRKLYRFAEFKKWTTFTGNEYANNNTIAFTVTKRENNLYSIEFPSDLSSGEYAIRFPGNADTLRLFGID